MLYLLREIGLRKIKGFERLDVDLTKQECVPNKVNFIVGSNGRGKTTIATAFSKLSANSLQLDKDEKYKGSEDYSLFIKGLDEKEEFVLEANSSKNEISDRYDVIVINSLSLLKSTTQRIPGSHVVPGKRIKSQKISIYNKNERQDIKYKQSYLRTIFPSNICKLLINISELLKNESFVKQVKSFAEIKSLKKVNKAIEAFKSSLVSLGNKSKSVLIEQIRLNNLVEPIVTNEKLSPILNGIKSIDANLDDIDICIIILQLDYLNFSREEINKTLDYFDNDIRYTEIKSTLSLIDPEERFFTSTNGELILEINNINSLSSGERDLLILIAEIEKLLYRNRLNKDKILIFDDIFDYLDGANILFFQYFILKIIRKFKKEGKKVFIFLFTHLDPSFFSTFQMNKVNIYNLESKKHLASTVIENMICKRESLSEINQDILSKFYLHYSIDAFDSHMIEAPCEIDDFFSHYNDPYEFKKMCTKEVDKFIEGKEFDIYMVSIGIRVLCEKYLYGHLEDRYKDQFLALHGRKKIEMFDDNDIYLEPMIEILNKTYNELEHITLENKDQKMSRFLLRINNLFIKNLLKNILS